MINNNKVAAIIPARANSVGCPGKNYREINGKPLFMWSVEAALNSKYIDSILISTNDEEVSSIAKKHPLYDSKIFVIQRPESFSSPDSKTEWAMIHALYDRISSEYFDIACLLQPTSPARRNNLVDSCLEKMIHDKHDSVLTVTEKTPFFWNIKKVKGSVEYVCDSCKEVLFSNKNNECQNCFHEIKKVINYDRYVSVPRYSLINRPMRQDLDITDMCYHDNGNFYACYARILFQTYSRVGSNVALFSTPFFESLQIDTEEDFSIMKKMVELYGSFL